LSEQRIKEKKLKIWKKFPVMLLLYGLRKKQMKKFSSILTHCMRRKSNTLYFRIRNARNEKRVEGKKIKIPSKNKEIRSKFTGQF
jgi:hypothetical protein